MERRHRLWVGIVAFAIATIEPVSPMGGMTGIGTANAQTAPPEVAPGGEPPEADPPPSEPTGEATPSPDTVCFPECRRGYVCARGQCVSACNPPCPEGRRCTEEGECVAPPSATASGSAAVPPSTHGTRAPAGGPSDALGAGPSGSFNLRFGPTISWFGGGHLGLEPAFRMTDGVYLVPAFHLAGGTGFEGSDQSWVSAGTDLGFRILRWRRVGWVAHVGAGTTFLGEFWGNGLDYSYVAPYARLGGGLLFAKGERFAWGVELTTRLGYAINVNGSYDAFFGGLDISIVLTL